MEWHLDEKQLKSISLESLTFLYHHNNNNNNTYCSTSHSVKHIRNQNAYVVSHLFKFLHRMKTSLNCFTNNWTDKEKKVICKNEMKNFVVQRLYVYISLRRRSTRLYCCRERQAVFALDSFLRVYPWFEEIRVTKCKFQ